MQHQRRGYRLALDEPSTAIEVSRDGDPLLYVVAGASSAVHVHKARTGRLLRSIPEIGSANRIQVF